MRASDLFTVEFKSIQEKVANMSMPRASSVERRVWLKAIAEKVAPVDDERVAILKEFCEFENNSPKLEGGIPKLLEGKDMGEFVAAWNELMSAEIEIPKLKRAWLPWLDKLELTAVEDAYLEAMLEEVPAAKD